MQNPMLKRGTSVFLPEEQIGDLLPDHCESLLPLKKINKSLLMLIMYKLN